MHFSIPDTQECTDHNGSNYTGFNIHINGEYHCTVRYKQLFNLHEQLKKFNGNELNFPPFPPKKYLPLTPNQLEDRRSLLEKYIQAVGQSTSIINIDLFYAFLLTAQQESTGERVRDVTIDVFLMNGYKITVSSSSNERSYSILEKACSQINLPNPYVYYFSLFLIMREENGDLTIIRKLQDFESPYISQKNIPGNLKIMLRKSYWDPEYDLELMHDRVALNLLYVQTVSDIEKRWILCGKNIREQLAILQARGAKKEYLDVARNLRYYGYVQFKECICDFPTPDSKVLVSAGERELNLRIEVPGGEIKDRSFKVTRMRCWRITTHNDIIETDIQTVLQKDPQLDLSFEYLISKDNLQWITITSEQAILMAVCLQSIVDELLLKKSGAKFKQPSDFRNGSFSYMKRDGSSQVINLSQSSSEDTLSSSPNGTMRLGRNEPTMSMKKLSEKLSNLTNRNSNNTRQPLVENDAFEGIGDEDL
uniref:Putative sorting nexin-17 n=1 Tax=Triatoma dimidiata TaxID=72491 RepID=A0A0V0G6X8_TRIDM